MIPVREPSTAPPAFCSADATPSLRPPTTANGAKSGNALKNELRKKSVQAAKAADKAKKRHADAEKEITKDEVTSKEPAASDYADARGAADAAAAARDAPPAPAASNARVANDFSAAEPEAAVNRSASTTCPRPGTVQVIQCRHLRQFRHRLPLPRAKQG